MNCKMYCKTSFFEYAKNIKEINKFQKKKIYINFYSSKKINIKK